MILSNLNMVDENKVDFPMKRERYLSTWKVFRSISDENTVTAKHILSLESVGHMQSLVDIGCGDGLITKNIVLNSPEQINKITLIDPDKKMLEEAFLHLSEIGLVTNVQKECSPFENCYHAYLYNSDVILAVHLVYLIQRESFELLLQAIPIGKTLIVVLDDEGSIFTQLWQRTAPKYAQRSAEVRAALEKINDNYMLRRTTITSKIRNPLLHRTDIKESLLSLMSYHDFSLMDNNDRKFVEQHITQNLTGNFVRCTSSCYEITRLQ